MKRLWSMVAVIAGIGLFGLAFVASRAGAGGREKNLDATFVSDQVIYGPIGETQINIDPIAPTAADIIQITASGVWSNSCVPQYESHQVLAEVIAIYAVTPPPDIFCLLVISTWSFTVEVGPLAPDTYTVEVYGTGGPVYTTSFTVDPSILINAVYYDTYLSGEPDEAIQLLNRAADPIDLANWTVTDFEGEISLSGSLAGGQALWLAREAAAFYAEFGFWPDYEYQSDTDPLVPDLPRSGSLTLANSGDQVALFNAGGQLVDAVVYEDGDPAETDWSGEGIEPYNQGFFGLEGQILYRKLDQETGLPGLDTGTASDWAQAADDDINGKKVRYPGWDLERYVFPHQITETATITYVVAPDHIYEVVAGHLENAQESIYYEGYTFENAHLADLISNTLAAHPGMTVTMLLEGAPVGGIEDQQKRNCQVVEEAGGQCWFMINDNEASPVIHDRYTYQHAKVMIIDGQYLLTSSENLNYSSMPADDKGDGTAGNRGVWLITDGPDLVAYARDVFRHDFDPANHRDLIRWTAAHPTYGAPLPEFVPTYLSGGSAYTVAFTDPLSLSGEFAFEVVQAPENALRSEDSLLGMVARAGRGDRVLVEQLYERTYWGPSDSNPSDDPNPRLAAYIAAARQGAVVYLLLDSVFDDPADPRGNTATCAYVNGVAATESLLLRCLSGNPTGNGIHNKMVLVYSNGEGWVHTGSINGSENSSKSNRELAVQVRSMEAYEYLAAVFWHDWYLVGGEELTTMYLPLVMR